MAKRKKRLATHRPSAPVGINENESTISFVLKPNPKMKGSKVYTRYAKYKKGMTIREALDAGITLPDLRWDVDRGYINIDLILP